VATLRCHSVKAYAASPQRPPSRAAFEPLSGASLTRGVTAKSILIPMTS
jgi:hypothetical protein